MDMLEAIARRGLAEIEQRLDRLHAASHFSGPVGMLGAIASLQRTDTPERLDRYEARLSAFPAYLDAWTEVARDGVAAGVTSPAIVVDRAIEQLERVLALGAAESPALAPLRGPRRRRPRPGRRGRRADAVNPALAALPGRASGRACRTRPRRWASGRCPAATSIYASQVLAWTTLPLDPSEVHELGVASVRRDPGRSGRRSRAASASPTPRRRSQHAPCRARTRRHTATRSCDSRPPRSNAAWTRRPASSAGCRPPSARSGSSRPFHEADMAFAFYWPPSGDGTRPGVYYVNGYDLPTRPLHIWPASRSTRRCPATTSSSRSSRRCPIGRPCAGSAASWRAARSPKGGACTPSASPTRWACTSTSGSGSACSTRRSTGRRAW